ncbi:glycosyltransferase family 4 protein [Chloroflexota bacterium]
MNLLYTLTAYPPSIGGAQLHQHLLAQHLSSRHNIQVATFWDENRTDWLLGTTLKAPSISNDYKIDGISVHQIGLTFRQKLQTAPFVPFYYPLMEFALPPISQAIQAHLRPFMADVDLIHNVRIGREGLTDASYKMAHKHDVPFVLTPVHHPRWKGWRYRVYNHLYKVADAIIALTAAEKRLLISYGVNENRIHITGHGPHLAEVTDAAGFLQHHKLVDGPVILFLGQHYPYKGYVQLLEAAALVWQDFPEAHFVFIGPGVGNSEQLFATHSDPRIHRLGKVSLQEKSDALAACTLLCVPSTQESFGGVYTEAWRYGKPVIGCDIPAVAEVIADGEDGFLVAQKPEAIAARIRDLLQNPTDAARMGAVGREKVQRKFTWDALARKTEEVYKTVL